MSDKQIYYEFSEFGKYIYYAGIFYLLSFFLSFIGSIGVLIVILMALQRIKSVNQRLQNPLLNEFYSRLLAAQIIYIIGSVVTSITAIIMVVTLYPVGVLSGLGGMSSTIYQSQADLFAILYSLLAPLIIGAIITYVGLGLTYSAWGKFQLFLAQNQFLPSQVAQSASDNAGKLKTASLMMILSFLVITACIGIIFNLIGYFGLGGDLKDLQGQTYQAEPSMGMQGPSPGQPQKTITTDMPTPKFCPKCGTPLKGAVKFCPVCGNQFKPD